MWWWFYPKKFHKKCCWLQSLFCSIMMLFAPMYVSCVPHKSQILFDLLCFNLRVMTLDEGPRSQGPMNSSILYWSKALNWSQEGLQTRGSKTKKWQIEAKTYMAPVLEGKINCWFGPKNWCLMKTLLNKPYVKINVLTWESQLWWRVFMCFEILPFCHKVQFGICQLSQSSATLQTKHPSWLANCALLATTRRTSSNQLKET
jgi:hypothetical protein